MTRARGSKLLALLAVIAGFVPINAHAATVLVSLKHEGVWRRVLCDGVTNKCFVGGTTSSGSHGEYTVGPGAPPLGAGSFHQVIGLSGSDGQRVETSGWNHLTIPQMTQIAYSTFVTADSQDLTTSVELMVDVDGDGLMTPGLDEVLKFEPKFQVGKIPGTPNQCGPDIPPQCIKLSTWQNWDARVGAWEDTQYGGTVSFGFTTLDDYATTHPLARLANDLPALRFPVGFGGPEWIGYDGNFDALRINGNSYDFEDPPDAPVVTSPANNATVFSGAVPFVGTLSTETGVGLSGAKITIAENGTIKATVTTGAGGAWSVSIAFADGPHTLTITGSNGGYSGPSILLSITVAHTPVFSTPVQNSILHSTVVTTTGTSGAGQTIDITEGATALGSTVTPPGCSEPCTWSVGPFILPEGLHTISATATDGSGTSPKANDTFTIDITPVFTSPSPGFLNDANPEVAGTAGAGMTITVKEGATTLGTTTTTPGCTFPCSWSIGHIHFTEGTHTITATATEGSQNSKPASLTFTVDTVAPAKPVITNPTEGQVLPSGSVDVAGTAEPKSTVKIFEGGSQIGTASTSDAGTWDVVIGFSNGSHTITATATDAAGNVSPPSDPRHFTVNVVFPATPVILFPTEGSFVHSPVTISGTAPVGTNVTVFEGPITFGTVPVANDGSWSIIVSLIDGQHKVQAFDVDQNGNASGITPGRNFIVDNTGPTVTMGSQLFIENGGIFPRLDVNGFAQDNIRVARIRLTYTPLLLGSALQEDAQCEGCGLSGFVTWEDFPSLDPGVYRVVAVAYDEIGNISAPARATLIVL